jgi:hypothetical protein
MKQVRVRQQKDKETIPHPSVKHEEEVQMKGITVKFALSMAVAGLIVAAGSAFAQNMPVQQAGGANLSIDPATLNTVDQALLKMQQEMIAKNYSSMLLKPQMMSKMMGERAPQNFMQNVIQPVMMEKMRDQIKPQQMQIMTTAR